MPGIAESDSSARAKLVLRLMCCLGRGGQRRFGGFNSTSASDQQNCKTTFGWFLFFLLGCRFDTLNLFNFAYMSVVVSMRHYLSIGHLSAALLFAKQCQDLEESAKSTPIDGTERRLHAAYAVSSIILAAAFLEATINELFSDCADADSAERLSDLQARSLMGRLWGKGVPRTAAYSILEKYEIALELNGKPAIDPGAMPYQDVKLLVDLRNALIHYEPETIACHGVNQQHKFEKRLAGKFATNQLTGAGNPFYPDKVLGAGCARWAINAAVAFADEFFHRLGIAATYEHVRSLYLNVDDDR